MKMYAYIRCKRSQEQEQDQGRRMTNVRIEGNTMDDARMMYTDDPDIFTPVRLYWYDECFMWDGTVECQYTPREVVEDTQFGARIRLTEMNTVLPWGLCEVIMRDSRTEKMFARHTSSSDWLPCVWEWETPYKDDAGVAIYDGDLLALPDGVYHVTWDYTLGAWAAVRNIEKRWDLSAKWVPCRVLPLCELPPAHVFRGGTDAP